MKYILLLKCLTTKSDCFLKFGLPSAATVCTQIQIRTRMTQIRRIKRLLNDDRDTRIK